MMGISGLCRTVIVGAVLGLSGCGASTDVTSQTNPEFAGRTYRKMMVEADITDLKWRRAIESGFCDRIQDKTTTECVQSAAVFFPGQPYTSDEIKTQIQQQAIEVILVVQASNGTSSTYLPPTYYTTGSASVYGNTVTGQSTTQTFGGGYINKPWADYQTSLWSTQDGKVVWYATEHSRGNAFAKWGDLVESAAEETVSHMMDDGVIQEKKD
jgi:hypothetical protein